PHATTPSLHDALPIYGYAQTALGSYDNREYRGALNLPVGAIAAARLSVYSSKHDPFVKNVGPLSNLLGWESQDDAGGRMHFLLQDRKSTRLNSSHRTI